MAVQIRPMLAAKVIHKDAALTAKNRAILSAQIAADGCIIGQPKIDGMRVLCHDDARSRSWKPWVNQSMQAWVKDNNTAVWGWDGEMIGGHIDIDVPDPETFRRAMSELRSQEGAQHLTYFLFDTFDPGLAASPYRHRYNCISDDVKKYGDRFVGKVDGVFYDVKVVLVPNKLIASMDELDEFHLEMNARGWEGTITRRAMAPYKYNRSTNKEGYLTKIKDEDTAEAIIEGYDCAYENTNEPTISALGYTVRSAHQANSVPKDYLGVLHCHLAANPAVKFKIGVFHGLTQEDKRKLLQEGDALIGRAVVFTAQDFGGGYDKPRTPVFHYFRPKEEM